MILCSTYNLHRTDSVRVACCQESKLTITRGRRGIPMRSSYDFAAGTKNERAWFSSVVCWKVRLLAKKSAADRRWCEIDTASSGLGRVPRVACVLWGRASSEEVYGGWAMVWDWCYWRWCEIDAAGDDSGDGVSGVSGVDARRSYITTRSMIRMACRRPSLLPSRLLERKRKKKERKRRERSLLDVKRCARSLELSSSQGWWVETYTCRVYTTRSCLYVSEVVRCLPPHQRAIYLSKYLLG